MNDYITEKMQHPPTENMTGRRIIAEMKVLFIEMMRSHHKQSRTAQAN